MPGGQPAGDTYLHLYAADLARSPDGRWWVIADRTQAPSGAGYALENRTIIGRVFPEQFRDLHVQHLASFFRELQDSLAYWAAPASEAPLIVLLTPGPYNETYFEHAYLARYLGFPLVEGHDLTVRGECVYLRTLSGLRRVHAILRRLDDDYCDPLELRGDSALGVPGLLQAVRAGNVLVANALGSGLLESAALPGFLPGICEKLLGEPLAMPSVATWWCGEQAALEFTIEHLDKLVIKGSYPSQRFDPVFGNELIGSPREEMIARLKTPGHRPMSPRNWSIFRRRRPGVRRHDRHLLPRGVGLRVFVAATPSGYVVMPGGLTRVSAVFQCAGHLDAARRFEQGHLGIDRPGGQYLQPAQALGRQSRPGARRPQPVVASGREPVLVRPLRRTNRQDLAPPARRAVTSGRYRRRHSAGPDLGFRPLPCPAVVAAPSAKPRRAVLPRSARQRPSCHSKRNCLPPVCGKESGEGLAGDIRRLLWVATQVRERFSLDNWHAINRLQQQLQRYAKTVAEVGQPELSEVLAFLDQVLLVSSSLAGFAMDNMTRDDGWRFLIIGRRIERLVFLANTVAQFLLLDSTRAAGSLEWLLELTDSIITYRSRYMTQPQVLPTLDLIVFDEGNPHSVAFQLQILVRYLDNLTRLLGGPRDQALRQELARLQGFDLGRFEGQSFSECRACDPCLALAAILGEVSLAAATLSDRLAMRYFSHVSDVSRPTLTS
jgi:uncharacterized alpha-E superfamily protein